MYIYIYIITHKKREKLYTYDALKTCFQRIKNNYKFKFDDSIIIEDTKRELYANV